MNESQTNTNILLCPGQGAQHPGMGRAWFDASPAARATFEQADQVLGISLSQLCFEGPQEQSDRTDIAQAALYVAAVASFRGLQEKNVVSQPLAAAGLSLGEFTALHLAGAFDFETGLRLVRLRGQAMQDAAEAVPSGMVALTGADEAQANQVCDQAREEDVLVPANFNCPGQVVISGSQAACNRAVAVATSMGLRPTPLKVAGAFHSPLMAPAAARLAEALDSVAWQPLACPVLSNVTGAPHEDNPATISQLLIDQLTSPVRWEANVRWLLAHVPGSFVELAPGKVLAGMMRRIDRKLPVTSHAEPETAAP